MILKELSSGKIELNGLGLKLEVEPRWLLSESMNKESRKLLDLALENMLISALREFSSSWENTKEFRYKLYHKEVRSELIKKIATIERDLIYNLHSDGECIELSDKENEIRSFAHSVWRFDSEYGYVSTKEVKL